MAPAADEEQLNRRWTQTNADTEAGGGVNDRVPWLARHLLKLMTAYAARGLLADGIERVGAALGTDRRVHKPVGAEEIVFIRDVVIILMVRQRPTLLRSLNSS